VDLLSSFLTSTLRRLKRESHETPIAKALSGSESVRVTVELLDRRDDIGRYIIDGEPVETGSQVITNRPV
jgi:hypothetical protein